MKKGVFVFALSISIAGFSQVSAQTNLVPNPSFEDTIICISGYSDRPTFWFTPTAGSPDHFRPVGALGTCMDYWPHYWGGSGYSNLGGYQLPRTGNYYVGFAASTYPGGGNREFIAVRLTDSLKPNKRYIVSYYTVLGENGYYAIDAMGAAIKRDSVVDFSTNGVLPFSSDMDNYGEGVLTDTVNWRLITDTLLAAGGERYLYIGHLRSDDSTNFQFMDSIGANMSYYFVDDVSVILFDEDSLEPPQPPSYPEINLFPNPSMDGIFVIEYELEAAGVLEVYDMLGQVAGKIQLESGVHEKTIALLSFASGVFYYRILSNGKTIDSGKLTVIK